MLSTLAELRQQAITGTEDSGGVLLRAASRWTQRQPAGLGQFSPMPLPTAVRTLSNPRAAFYLQLIATADHSPTPHALLVDWCTVARAKLAFAPSQALGYFIEVGTREPTLRPMICGRFGGRSNAVALHLGHSWIAHVPRVPLVVVNELRFDGYGRSGTVKVPRPGHWRNSMVYAYIAQLFEHINKSPFNLKTAAERMHHVAYWATVETLASVIERCERYDVTGGEFFEDFRAHWLRQIDDMKAILMFRQAVRVAFETEEKTDD